MIKLITFFLSGHLNLFWVHGFIGRLGWRRIISRHFKPRLKMALIWFQSQHLLMELRLNWNPSDSSVPISVAGLLGNSCSGRRNIETWDWTPLMYSSWCDPRAIQCEMIKESTGRLPLRPVPFPSLIVFFDAVTPVVVISAQLISCMAKK